MEQGVYMRYRCTDCGHEQTAWVLNPAFDRDGALLSWSSGSDSRYCQKCDGIPELMPEKGLTEYFEDGSHFVKEIKIPKLRKVMVVEKCPDCKFHIFDDGCVEERWSKHWCMDLDKEVAEDSIDPNCKLDNYRGY